MRSKPIFRFSAVSLLAVLALSLIAVAQGVFHPKRRPLLPANEIQARDMASRHDSELVNASISTRDGAVLSAWAIRPRNPNGDAVFLLHGMGDNRMGMIGYAELFLMHGFSVLLPDARAHGASGGQLATYGLLEAEDIHRWFDWLQQTDHPGCIFGFGESMGAAQLLQSLTTESRFCAVVAESSFSSFREISYDRVGQFFHTGPWLGRTVLRPTVEGTFLYARWKYNVNFERLSPERSVAATRVPVFLIHGQSDRNIPIRHALRIAARNPTLILWEVPNANHCGAVSAAPKEFEQRVIGWFSAHSQNKAISR